MGMWVCLCGRVVDLRATTGSEVYYEAIKRLVTSEVVFPGMEIIATTIQLQV